MTRVSCHAPRLPTLCGMPRVLLSVCQPAFAVCAAALVWCTPTAAIAQSGSIIATATVLPRPLSILEISRTAIPGEFRVRIDGCAHGALTVDARSATASVRTARHVIEAGGNCGVRTVAIRLTAAAQGTIDYLVSLEQSDAWQAPSFAQFIVSAREASRSSLAY
jgi:hypothetical protein